MLDASDITFLKTTFVTKDEFSDFKTEIGEMFTNIAEQLRDELSEKIRDEVHASEIRIMSVFTPHTQEEKEHYQELNEKYDRVMTAVDKLVGPIADLQQESAFAKGQHERQMEWNYKVAKKIDVPFDY